MHYFKIFVFCVVLQFVFGCAANSKKVVKDGVNMLYGEITRDNLFSEYPEWYADYLEYEPDSTIINSLSTPHPDLKIDIFLGTWCSDSRREVPRFFKTVDESKFVEDKQINMWAVDRSNSLESGLTVEKNITNVATFILYKNNEEIGRIIERPDNEKIETDILSIINGS